ncbi:related to heterokaryon incompatibility protein het-6 [Cephalotrichum gorgonifer]|uniref:Related to heterokaryon incompatibility protein het-6 n=1 Tax=Cephalotrichum gorgonifer TaxID=2041049 RepID=A0AAE8SSD7_9PEZI|nr:related to heterokaryon incompatibility protein het-6 [Cephalotrichum gorgonifer]
MAPYNWPGDTVSPPENARDNPFRPQNAAYHSDDESVYPRQLPSRPRNPALPPDQSMMPPGYRPPPPLPYTEPPPHQQTTGWFEPPKVRIRSASVAPSLSMYSVPPDWLPDPHPRDRLPYGAAPPYKTKDPLRTGYPTPMYPDMLRSPHPDRIAETETAESTTGGLEPVTRPRAAPSNRPLQYRALGDMEIRLLRILPERMSTLRCELIHASLDKPVKYVAISYARGDSGESQTIQVDGTTMSITSSLYGALKVLRRKSGIVAVWADALCIDQDNGEERTRQVQHMKDIYSKAQSVAVWLGPEGEASGLAMRLLSHVAHRGDSPAYIKELIGSKARRREFDALVRVFEREYWSRLWIVQEVFNATRVDVYCGTTRLPFDVYRTASKVFLRHKEDIATHFPPGNLDSKQQSVTRSRLPYAELLARHGPGSFPDISSLLSLGEASLLEILQACRNRHASVPHDKVFGILGVLPEEMRENFKPDYALTVRDVYINVVDYLVTTTERLDVICESIHFPPHTSTTNLPTWTPDWSHIPQATSLGLHYDFKAAGSTKAKWSFKDGRSKLAVSAVFLDVVKKRGVAVGTLCSEDDYLMAFMHWRALLVGDHEPQDKEGHAELREAFCRTLCVGQIPPQHKDPRKWSRVCYQVFASMIHERLPYMPLDRELTAYASSAQEISIAAQQKIAKETCGERMKGRCLFVTQNESFVGIGTGAMLPGDIIVVPLGCYSPVILRPEGRGEYIFVGDVYVDGYMYGEAIDELDSGQKEMEEYVIC